MLQHSKRKRVIIIPPLRLPRLTHENVIRISLQLTAVRKEYSLRLCNAYLSSLFLHSSFARSSREVGRLVRGIIQLSRSIKEE